MGKINVITGTTANLLNVSIERKINKNQYKQQIYWACRRLK
jgi:hypothetical protein